MIANVISRAESTPDRLQGDLTSPVDAALLLDLLLADDLNTDGFILNPAARAGRLNDDVLDFAHIFLRRLIRNLGHRCGGLTQ